MTATLTRLAFSGVMNSVYSSLLLLALGFVLYQWLRLRKSQSHWRKLWKTFESHTTARIETLQKFEGSADEFKDQLFAHNLTDLVAHLEVFNEPPQAEETSHRMIETGLRSHVVLAENHPTPESFARLPGLAIVLGLLGTFVGLTFALLQLPLGGGLKQLNEGIRSILPLMSAAFWTSVCGLCASLLFRFHHSRVLQFEELREECYHKLHATLSNQIRCYLYPRVGAYGLFDRPQENQSSLQVGVESAVEQLEKNQEVFLSAFARQWEEWQEAWKQQQEQMQELPQTLAPLCEQLLSVREALETWTSSLKDNAHQMIQVGQEISNTLNPIAHTEQLMSERLTRLTRHHEAMNQLLESLLAYEQNLPEAIKELLDSILRPAHRILQRSGDGLNNSIDMLLERNSMEREAWRTELQHFTTRLQVLEHLTQDTSLFTRELTQITSHLAEISDHLRFRRPLPTTEQEHENSESIDNEIDQLLENFDHRNLQSTESSAIIRQAQRTDHVFDLEPPQALPQQPEFLDVITVSSPESSPSETPPLDAFSANSSHHGEGDLPLPPQANILQEQRLEPTADNPEEEMDRVFDSLSQHQNLDDESGDSKPDA